jgi:hypothetical protein
LEESAAVDAATRNFMVMIKKIDSAAVLCLSHYLCVEYVVVIKFIVSPSGYYTNNNYLTRHRGGGEPNSKK